MSHLEPAQRGLDTDPLHTDTVVIIASAEYWHNAEDPRTWVHHRNLHGRELLYFFTLHPDPSF